MRHERSRERLRIRRQDGGWVLRLEDYLLWIPQRSEALRAAARLRPALADQAAWEALGRPSNERVMD